MIDSIFTHLLFLFLFYFRVANPEENISFSVLTSTNVPCCEYYELS